MTCPLPIINDRDSLKAMSGSKLAKAKPHPHSMPKDMDEGLILDDYRAVIDFLLENSASNETFQSYRREVDRFLIWLWFERKALLPDVRRSDIETYLEFIKNPPLSWRGTEVKHRFVEKNGLSTPNPEWRPFISRVSKAARKNGADPDERKWTQTQASLKSTMAILRTFFEFLLNEEHVSRNPVAQIKARSRKATSTQRAPTIKRLSRVQVNYLFGALEESGNRTDPERYERLRFILSCLISMYLRISEIASSGDRQPVHGDFFYKIHDAGQSQDKTWWFKVIGKGNKLREIPVSNDLLEALRRYRSSLGLSPLPAIGEKLPLFLKTRGKGGLTSSRHVRAMLQELFDIAEQKLRSDGLADEADGLLACTVHWLRHTGISEDVQVRPLPHVRDGAGHSSIATTGIYVDNDDLEMHRSAEQSSLLSNLNR